MPSLLEAPQNLNVGKIHENLLVTETFTYRKKILFPTESAGRRKATALTTKPPETKNRWGRPEKKPNNDREGQDY